MMDTASTASPTPLQVEKLRRVLFVLVAATTAAMALEAIAALMGHDHLLGFGRRLDARNEASIHAWLGSLLLGLCAGLLALISVSPNRLRWRQWQVLSLGFLFLSADEIIQLHERLVGVSKALFGASSAAQLWTILGALVCGALAITFWGFLRHLPAQTQREFAVAAVLFLGGALGLEALEGAYVAIAGKEGWLYFGLPVAEECLELSGAGAFVLALARYMSHGPEIAWGDKERALT